MQVVKLYREIRHINISTPKLMFSVMPNIGKFTVSTIHHLHIQCQPRTQGRPRQKVPTNHLSRASHVDGPGDECTLQPQPRFNAAVETADWKTSNFQRQNT